MESEKVIRCKLKEHEFYLNDKERIRKELEESEKDSSIIQNDFNKHWIQALQWCI